MLYRNLVTAIATVLTLLPSLAHAEGDAVRGEALFKRCAACHTAVPDRPNGIGPNLFGVYGSEAGKREIGFKFSPALTASGITWDEEALDRWLTHPRGLVPKTRMAFPGIAQVDQRSDIIAYLKTLQR